ncbi:MAG: hypothetical protein CSA81_14255, partial [Acidobacteria bacterium]
MASKQQTNSSHPLPQLLCAALLCCFIATGSQAGSVKYSYSEAGRLTEVSLDDSGNIAYSYDKTGNRLSLVTTSSGSSSNSTTIWEDGEDGNTLGWDIYDNDPPGAAIAIVHDDEAASQVVEFTGAAMQNGYRLRQADGTDFNETEHKILQWSVKYSENFVIYIAVQTTLGFRYLYYTTAETSNLGDGSTIHHGLGRSAADGSWHTFTRDLSYDLKDAQPDNELLSVQAFLIRGSGRIDNISLHSSLPDDLDSD